MSLNLLILLLQISPIVSLHLRGDWTNSQKVSILSRFGFQKTNSLNLEHTRGFIYGNVTSESPINGHQVLLLLLDREQFRYFYTEWQNGNDCGALMNKLSEIGYERTCYPKGVSDLFRKTPCEKGKLCEEEDNPDNVLGGYQMTFRIQEPNVPAFWYLSLVSCMLDSNCNWTQQSSVVKIQYSLWLVNGNPTVKYSNPFEHQFSFDEQDTAEIYLAALVVFLCLSLLQSRSIRLMPSDRVPQRSWLLLWVLVLACAAIVCNLLHVLVFAFDGDGAIAFRWCGDVLWLATVQLLVLTIILLSRGWSILTMTINNKKLVLFVWSIGVVLHLICFIWNSQAVDELEEIDIFQTWPGWGIMLLRLMQMLWFMYELKKSIHNCHRSYRTEKGEFLTHFGAAFLVWFIYLPILGLVVSQVSILWRFKIILGITYLSDFIACSILLHLFWPRSTNRRFFLEDNLQNQSIVLPQDDLEEFEKALVEEEIIPSDPLDSQFNPDNDI